jgi:hypothetical protein
VTIKFDVESDLVGRLLQRLGLAVSGFTDPNAVAGRETGVDVAVLLQSGERIGVQVTELDTGNVPGMARSGEKRSAQEAAARGSSVYGGWGQNDATAVVAAVARSIDRKAAIAERHDLAGYDEVWLLVCAGIPTMGAVVSTFVMTPWLDPRALTIATAGTLGRSKFGQAFFLPIVGLERALYRWQRGGAWSKQVVQELSERRGPSVFDLLRVIRQK